MLDMAYIRALEIATFYTMFHLAPVGKVAHVQVCGTTPCWLRGADDLKEVCRRRIHPEPHHLSEDGCFSWEEVECLGACVNAPLVQIGADTYEDLTAGIFDKLLGKIAAGEFVRPGTQVDRINSAPVGGPTTLTGEIYRGGGWTEQGAGSTLADSSAKKPTEAASVREAPVPKPPVAPNPEDQKPDPVAKG
jgi:NADH-quinone oxidoreductase subunit E